MAIWSSHWPQLRPIPLTIRNLGHTLWAHAPGWLPFVIVVGMGWSGARLTWSLWSRPRLRPPPVSAQTRSKTPETVLARAITRYPLFGHPSLTAGPKITTTHLALTLLGVAAAPTKKNSWAIIALGAAGAPQRVFGIGDLIPGGARLVSIRPQEVILSLAGELQALKLNTGNSSMATGPQIQSPQRSSLPLMLARQPLTLLKYIRPMPVFKAGHFAGYRVFPGARPRAFLRLGLSPGDIIQSINGITLTNPIQSLNLIHRLALSHQPITLTVTDHGQTREITIPPTQP